jgi:hypothetical protein
VAADPRLTINGAPADLLAVWIHHQDDPYPGGCHYALHLPKPLADEWASYVGLTVVECRGRLQAPDYRGLSWLDCVLMCWRMRAGVRTSKPYDFVLNTIDDVAPTGDGVEVRGACSPFVRRTLGQPQ